MLLAGRWAREAIESGPAAWRQGLLPEFVAFLVGLDERGRRKGRALRKVEIPRRFAEALALSEFIVLGGQILADEIPSTRSAAPSAGFVAFVEILTDIAKAIRRGTGRPMEVDPLVAFDLYLQEKQTRERGAKGSETSVERVAMQLGASSRVVDTALSRARPLAEAMQLARAKGRKMPLPSIKRGKR
jgi:hypothetical protein